MKKWLKALLANKNLTHLVINMLIIAATTITAYTDTVKAMLVGRGFSPEAAILATAFILLCAKEFLLNCWKTDAQIIPTAAPGQWEW